MPTIIKSALPMILIGLLAGCVGGGGYYSSGGYGGGGYDQPYQPYGYGYGYAPSYGYSAPSYNYSFSYYGGDRDYGSGGGNYWRNSNQNHDYGRSYVQNREQDHWQSQPTWKKKKNNWSQ